jgi:hypothetical protein
MCDLLSVWFCAQRLDTGHVFVVTELSYWRYSLLHGINEHEKLLVAAEPYSEPISFSSYLHGLFPNLILSFVLGMGAQRDILLWGPLRNMLQKYIFHTLHVECIANFNFRNLTTITI